MRGNPISFQEDSIMSPGKNFTAPHTEAAIADYNIEEGLDFSEVPPVARYVICLVMTAMATAVAAGFDRYEAIPNLSLIYVIPVVIGSVLFGLGPSLFSAVLGALAYNFFFTEPRFSLAVADTANIWAIVLLFVIACIISAITAWGHRKGIDLERTHRMQAALKTYAGKMVASRSMEESTKLTLAAVTGFFHSPAVVVFPAQVDGEPEVQGAEKLSAIEIEAAKSAWNSRLAVTGGVYPYDESRFDFWPVATASGQQAIIGVAFDPDRRPANPDGMMDIVALVFGTAIDRYRA
jgi:K+-sensing histidine kinase KdpD